MPAAAGHRPLLLAMALAAGFAASPAWAQPSGAQAIHGTATLSQQGSHLTVTTQNGAGTSHSAINWQSFNIPQGSTTHFAQPNAASTAINRVVAPHPSQILGTLSSNGRLVLVNPHGIAVGAGASIDTAGFTASTLRMSDADAIAGRLRFDGGNGAALRVEGQVVAREGDVVLIGQNVEAGREAVIQSPNGATVLAAGQKVQVTGRGLEGIHFEVQAPSDQAVNLGTLKGDAVGIFAGTLRHSGLVQARAVTTAGGKVVLKAADQVEVSGTVTAQRQAGAGGSVDVLGAKVGVLAGATIDTSNTAGGGQIRVGGDYKGQNPELPNAQVTYVDAGATLRASATVQGDGGRVIVWADDTARVHGTLEARGGPLGGNGGFVETSGKRVLDVQGARVSAAATAPAGQAGTWLLDPANVTVRVNGTTTAGEAPWFRPAETGESVVTVAALNEALAGGSGTVVIISTDSSNPVPGNGDIVFDGTAAAGGEIQLRRAVGGTALLLLDAAGDIVFRGATSFGAVTPAPAPAPPSTPAPRRLDVVLTAGARGGPGGIRSEAGSTVQLHTDHNDHDVTLYVALGRTWTNDGTLSLNLNGRLVLVDPDSFASATLVNGAGGRIDGAAGPRGGLGGHEEGDRGAWGWLHNAGTIALAQGAIDVQGFAQTAGTTRLSDGADLHARQQFAIGGGTFAFTGRNVVLAQAVGDLVLPAGSGIDATGSAFLLAHKGDLWVQGPIHADAQVTLAAEPGSACGGAIRLDAPVTAGHSLALAALGRNAMLDAGISQGDNGWIAAPELLVEGGIGAIRLTHAGNAVDSLAVHALDVELVNNADVLRIRGLSHEGIGGRSWAFSALEALGDVRIDNRGRTCTAGELPAGSIRLEGETPLRVGSLDLKSTGDIALLSPSLLAAGPIDIRAGRHLQVLASLRTRGGAVTLVAGAPSLGSGSGRLLVQGGIDTTDDGTLPGGAGVLLQAAGESGEGPSVRITGDVDAGLDQLRVQGSGDIELAGTTWSAGAIEVVSANGVLDIGESRLAARAPAGAISLQAGAGVAVSDASLASAGGRVHLQSARGGVVLVGSQVGSAGGSIVLEGGTAKAVSDDAGAVLWDSTLDAGSGAITVRGHSADFHSDAVALVGRVRLDAGAGTLIEGWHASQDPQAEGGTGVRIGEAWVCASDCLTGTGDLLIRGHGTASWHPGVVLGGASLSRVGRVDIEGHAAAGPLGVRIAGSDIRTHGRELRIASQSGVSVHASSLATAGGNLHLAGGSGAYHSAAGSAAVDISGGSSLHAGTGQVAITATTDQGTAFKFSSDARGGGLTISGADVSIIGTTAGGAGLLIDNETITATNSLTLKAIGGGLVITDGSRVENAGPGLMVLEARSGDPLQPASLRVEPGAVVTSAGSIRITADTLELLAPVVSAGGQIELVPLDLSRPITLGDGATGGTLNFSQATLDLLRGDTVFIGGASYTGGIRVLSAITVGTRTLSLVSQGDITQAAGARITAGSLVLDGRSVLLPDVLVADGGAISGRARAGDFLVRNQSGAGTLTIGDQLGLSGVAATGAVLLTTGGTLKLAAPVRSEATGNAITLVAGSLAGHAGGTLHTVGGARWLVYLDAPTASLAGAPVSGNHAVWATTFAGTPPQALAPSGHRYVFAHAPVVTIGADSVTRTYDGTPAFGLTSRVTGVVDAALHGGVFEQDVVTAWLHLPGVSKNVGEYDIQLASHLMPEGYVLGAYHGAKARITPRVLTLAARAENKVYDGTTSAQVVLDDDRIAGDQLAVSATGNFADRNAGAGKRVAIDGVVLSGADAGNYVLAAPSSTSADIEARDVTVIVRALTKEQGQLLDFQGTEFDVRPGDLVGDERITRVALQSEGAPASAAAGSYTIAASNAVGDRGFSLGNYRITYNAGTLEVSAAAAAVQQVQNAVNVFTTLLAKEAEAQQEQRAAVQAANEDASGEKKDDKAEDKKDGKESKTASRRKKEAIVSEESCKPG